MSCSIKNGKYFAPNGEESILYKSLRKNMSEDEANDLFILSKTSTFIERTANYQEFDKNGEIKASVLLQYTADNFSQTLPLNAVEKSHLINLQIEGVETSDDLYRTLYDAFYKNNLFSPNINKLKRIYSEEEIRNILEDSEIQGRVKDTIDKLRHTEEFTIPQINHNKDFDYRSTKVNIIGQYKKENPLRLEQKFKEQSYLKVPVVNEAGEQLETQMFYENAIKVPSDKAIRAVNAVVNAHPMVDTAKLENNIIKSFKKYGMDIEGLERENFKELLDYVTNPTDENRKSLEDALGFVREPLTRPINISPENRSYQYLKTAKSEQELFDEMSLIQTNEKNVYHKINKIDEQEMRDIQNNQDLTIPDYQLYKDYYSYATPKVSKDILTTEADAEYLTNDFIADFAAEKIKTPTEFNKQFKVTENGLELVSDDVITLEIVKAYIQDGAKYSKEIADYFLISKDMPNLKEGEINKRAEASNNPNSVSKTTTEITILDEESVYAPNETNQFIRIGDDTYEQQEAGYYNKMEKNTNPNYFLAPKAPEFKNFDIKQEEVADTKAKKLIDKTIEEENFSCT